MPIHGKLVPKLCGKQIITDCVTVTLATKHQYIKIRHHHKTKQHNTQHSHNTCIFIRKQMRHTISYVHSNTYNRNSTYVYATKCCTSSGSIIVAQRAPLHSIWLENFGSVQNALEAHYVFTQWTRILRGWTDGWSRAIELFAWLTDTFSGLCVCASRCVSTTSVNVYMIMPVANAMSCLVPQRHRRHSRTRPLFSRIIAAQQRARTPAHKPSSPRL